MAADDGRIQVFQEPHGARVPARVRGELEEVDAVRDRQGAREIGEKDGAGLERRDEQRLAAGIRLGQLGAELVDAAADLVAGQIDLPDGVAVGREATG